MTPTQTLPTMEEQAAALIGLGLHEAAGLSTDGLREHARDLGAAQPSGLLVIHPDRLPCAALVPLLQHREKSGFVVVDLPDLEDFAPLEGMELPPGPVYAAADPDRGDHLANWSPNEAVPALRQAGRWPMTIGEAVQWLLHRPDLLERNRCFMAAGSRLRTSNGDLDPRVPALWISNGTGRDGPERRHAPKVGWCWAGNRHTWLGFASISGRRS